MRRKTPVLLVCPNRRISKARRHWHMRMPPCQIACMLYVNMLAHLQALQASLVNSAEEVGYPCSCVGCFYLVVQQIMAKCCWADTEE